MSQESALARIRHQLDLIGADHRLRIAIAAVALLANIGFYLPRVPDVGGAGGVPGLDKIVHIGVFALTVWGVGRLLAPVQRFPMGWVVLGALGHALLIELIQSLMPLRSADGADLLADVVGIGLGLLAWHVERRRHLSPGSA